MSVILILAAAILIDLCFGEPRRVHPVIGMGNWIRGWRRWRPNQPVAAFSMGMMMMILGAAFCAVAGWSVESLSSHLSLPLTILLQAIVLKPTFSIRALITAVSAVKAPLDTMDLENARTQLSYHLVSRDTSTLVPSEIAGATIASLAENFTDSVLAPLFYYACLGLPGALVYRFVNTADAMVGYRTSQFEFFGKFAARVDDGLNLLPARIASLLLAGAGSMFGMHISLLSLMIESRKTPSPNGGWTMGAAALLLGIRLEKKNVYVLNPVGREPTNDDIKRAIRLVSLAMALGIGLMMGLAYVLG